MKAFLKKITLFLLVTLVLMFALDLIYTKMFSASVPRTKFQIFRSFEGRHIDYVFLGSSRVENGIIPSVIEEKTGKKAYNFGFQGSKLDDVFAMLKLLKEYNIQSEKVFVQIDYIFDVEGRSNALPNEMAPFIGDNAETENYFSSQPDFYQLKYIPFYRYCVFDQKIGFREMLLNFADKKTIIAATSGYSPLEGGSVNSVYSLPAAIRKRNATYDAMRKYCAENKIEIVFYCAPFWKGTQNLDYVAKLKTKIPDLKDYSMAIQDSTMFKNNPHLNDKGAHVFTEMLVNDLLKK